MRKQLHHNSALSRSRGGNWEWRCHDGRKDIRIVGELAAGLSKTYGDIERIFHGIDVH